MSLEISAPAKAPAPLPLQYVTAQIMPLIGGKFSVALQATLLDEEDFTFVAEDLAHTHVNTLDEALAVIRTNMAALQPPPSPAA